MEIKNFIKIYDEVLPWSALSNLIRFANSQGFEKTKVGGIGEDATINFNIRKTYTLPLFNSNKSLSNVHWHNILINTFGNFLKKYPKDLNILDFNILEINNIEILKYQDTGFYTWHVDHFAKIPRTMSCILLLNNDYEGGNLCFRNPDSSGEWEVEVKPNRLIIWPSNFLYPHTVKPVTKGTRYSVVAWAL
jgi:hypothetical protein